MVDVRPFRGVRYNAARFGSDLSRLICPPYDVISPAEDAALRGRHPRNMVRLEGPAHDPDERVEGADRYQFAAQRYGAWLADETLVPEGEPSVYAYRHTFSQDGAQVARRGLLAALRLAPWERNEVRPHERTHAGPKEDRLALIRACRANFSPIWCLYQDPKGATARLWEGIEGRPADVQAMDDDGILHEVWPVADPTIVRSLHDALAAEPAYIADGHHRYETALHYRDEVAAEARVSVGGDEAWNFTLTYLVEVSDPGLIVLGTHRVVAGAACGGIDPTSLRETLSASFDLFNVNGPPSAVLEAVESHSDRPAFGVWAPGYDLRALALLRSGDAVTEDAAPGRSAAWRRLDLAALHTLAIDRLFPQGSAALFAAGHLEYTREVAEVERLSAGDSRSVTFLVRTTPVRQVLDVADAGDRMPEKSTYFYPKPASGLVIARCDELLPRLA
jgi:uncharacterized protein (DUF1015 family)